MDREMVLSLVMRRGSESSHTAILARTMAIPSLIGADFDDSIDGLMGIVDGHTGEFIVDPDKETEERYRRLQGEEQKERETLEMLKGRKTVTRSGRKLRLYANISGIGDIQGALLNDAEGIGLFRSEFLYLGKDRYPSEEEQFQAYKTVAERMAGRKVIIRTMDIGADKQLDYAGMEHEENPAMGFRAIRICLKRPEIFKTQLRAILRASAFGDIAVMYPMITSLKEVERIRAIMEEAKAELREQSVPFKGEIEQGIMIETPAAAVISDLLAQEVDFFSIGTNDLTQYTLAIDRQNEKLEEFYDPHHEAVQRLIKLTIDNAHKAGIWAGICGELGADLSLMETFIKMGVDELSVAPGSILPIRKIVRSMD